MYCCVGTDVKGVGGGRGDGLEPSFVCNLISFFRWHGGALPYEKVGYIVNNKRE